MVDWLDEISLKTSGPSVSMGVRRLDDRPWLMHDEFAAEELNLKRELWSEVGVWMQERTQTLWDGGMPDEAAALYSEFSGGPALGK